MLRQDFVTFASKTSIRRISYIVIAPWAVLTKWLAVIGWWQTGVSWYVLLLSRWFLACNLTNNVSECSTHWGRMTHICVTSLGHHWFRKWLSPVLRQAIIWTIAGISLIGPFGPNFSEIWSEVHSLSCKTMLSKMSSAKCRLFCLGLNVLSVVTNM